MANCNYCENVANCSVCYTGYFVDAKGQCSICDETCSTCSINSTNCLSCPPSRFLSINNCVLCDSDVENCVACEKTDTSFQCLRCA